MKFRRDNEHSSVSPEGYRITLYRVGFESVYIAWYGRARVHMVRGTYTTREQAAEAFGECVKACEQHYKGSHETA